MNVTITLAMEMHLAVTIMDLIPVHVIKAIPGMATSAQIIVNIATATSIKPVVPCHTIFNAFVMITLCSLSMKLVPCLEVL